MPSLIMGCSHKASLFDSDCHTRAYTVRASRSRAIEVVTPLYRGHATIQGPTGPPSTGKLDEKCRLHGSRVETHDASDVRMVDK